MPNILISKAALDAIALKAVNPFNSSAVPMENGMFSVPISDETKERLDARRFPGETDSDVVMRVVGLLSGN